MLNPYYLPEPLRRTLWRYGPQLARTVVSLSTIAARIRLARLTPIRILVDNTVLFHSITHETAWISTGKTKWGPHDIETGYSARIPVRSAERESREYQNIRYLPGIAHLARVGKLALMSSGELAVERLHQPVGRFKGYGYFDHDLFGDIEMPLVDEMPDMHFAPSWLGLPTLEESRERRLAESDDALYRSLVNQLGPKNSQDAWHIRTAETYGMFCFLTMDFKLLKTLGSRARSEALRSLRTKVMTPQQFGKHFSLAPVNPVLLSFEDASSPIRPDLNWPDSKRHRPKRSADSS